MSIPNSHQNHNPGFAPLDTLAQLETDPDFSLKSCTNSVDKKTLQARARAKYLTSSVVIRLASVEKSPLIKSYWNSYHCSSVLEMQTDGKLTAQYCKNRWCLVCNRIRTAKLINQYRSVLVDQWPDRHFVTLTIPNVKAAFLGHALDLMYEEFTRIKWLMSKWSTRDKGQKLVCVRKVECTYNHSRDDFHPHFHIITENREMADTLISEWLRRFPDAVRYAQDVRAADDSAVVELFKYFTKIISKIKNSKGEHRQVINVWALDWIFRAMSKRRTFQPVGFKAPALEDLPEVVQDENEQLLSRIEISAFFEWDCYAVDWVNHDTGECISEYTPTDSMKKLCETIGQHIEKAAPVDTPKLYNIEKKQKGYPVNPATMDRGLTTKELISSIINFDAKRHQEGESHVTPKPETNQGTLAGIETTEKSLSSKLWSVKPILRK